MQYTDSLYDLSAAAVDHLPARVRLNSGLGLINSHEDTPIRHGGPVYIPWRPDSCSTLRTAILVSNGIPTGETSLAQNCIPPQR